MKASSLRLPFIGDAGTERTADFVAILPQRFSSNTAAIPALLVFQNRQPVARIGAREKQAMYAELAPLH